MRVSSGMIFDAGISSLGKQSAQLLQLQQQLSTGRKVLTPADDPVAAVGILEAKQALDMTQQYAKTHDNANSILSFAESQLKSAGAVLGEARTLVLQAGNPGLSDADRKSIAAQLRADFEQLLGLANTQDASGQYIFSGYMGNTQPFGGTVETGVSYFGDDGQRYLQVSSSQQLAVSDSGNGIFNRIANGNGVFALDYAGTNAGTAVIGGGSVINASRWHDASNSGNLEIRFWVDDGGTIGPANAVYYDLVDADTSKSLFTDDVSTAGGVGNSYTHAYVPGQPISFSGLAAPYNDFGINVTLTGQPADGDSFSVKNSTSQSVFESLRRIIDVLEQPIVPGSNDQARMSSEIALAIGNFDQAEQNFLTARSGIGSRMNRVESLQTLNTDLDVQYQQSLSNLQDVDYVQALSDLTRMQIQLQAAQQTFVQMSQLSLFNYI
ncbi:putative flagellar hook-associated protein 3 FlgL-like protein [Sterolibacterium denitrificans]|uniref:Flagellar hook-associated protein 3 FlgL-like protein n=2 Tax=Sterolibacterium denitrificans TaxID=157592 RepID=A0A7Z7HSP8_9PROT|nr:flagellar hook-associated protein FlgL [Sterolibacterium denitrificans]KYC29310.1 hypothetical protein ACY05_01915 [Sterolibacterium denitrificans]SMB30678.1 putative flagellar hook-associated protein 3 FlgL-like protein [Sterolibacterium denitrificans]